jgi:8-oxoguanine deaminase
MRLIIHHADLLYTCNDRDEVFRDGYLCIEDGRIVAVGSGEAPWQEADLVYDMRGSIVLPGFVNCHHHFFQSITRAVPLVHRTLSLDWMFGLYPLWAEYELEDLAAATLVSAVEQLLTGATTSVDHSNLHLSATTESADVQVEAAREVGIRYHFVRGSLATMEAGIEARLRPLIGGRVDRLLGKGIELVPLIERTLKKHQSRARGAMVDMSVGPGGVTYALPDLMEDHARLARDFDCGLHTHYHPRRVERDISVRLTGLPPISFLERSGWLGPQTWLAHCTELDAQEIAMLADRGCGVSHSPRTGIRLGYQLPPIARLRSAGVRVGIGVDGAASNDSGSMLGDLRLAQLLHRTAAADDTDVENDWLTPYDLLLMATRDGASILRRRDIGQLAPGMCGDVAAFNLAGASYAGAVGDPLGALFMSGVDTRAELTVVNGRPRVHKGRLIDLDEAAIASRADEAARRIMTKASSSTKLDFASYPGKGRRPNLMGWLGAA